MVRDEYSETGSPASWNLWVWRDGGRLLLKQRLTRSRNPPNLSFFQTSHLRKIASWDLGLWPFFSESRFGKKKRHVYVRISQDLRTTQTRTNLFFEDMDASVGDRGERRKFPLTAWEMTIASLVVFGFVLGLVVVYMTMPASDYSFLKLPRSLEDLQILRDNLESYTSDYTVQVLVGYSMVYIFMQTFMIPGTIFMSLLAGALFGVFKGVALVVFAATAGASSCFFLSKIIGRPLIFSMWPDKLIFFQSQVAKRRARLLNYMLFLRVTPTLPNTFINVASPIVDVPYHIFLLGTVIGLIPAAYVTVRAGITLGELQSVGDLYDVQSIVTLFLIGAVTVTPTLVSNKRRE